MNQKNELDIITRTVNALQEVLPMEQQMNLRSHYELPSVEQLRLLMKAIKGVIFPSFYGKDIYADTASLYSILLQQSSRGLASTNHTNCQQTTTQAQQLTAQFMLQLPEIKRLLLTDISAVTHNDPAATNYTEAVFCYPGVEAMLHYRSAHAMLLLGLPLLPRIITELAHQTTGIDIHPAAQIGEYFAIDHGTGIVIGETTIIGNHVMLYQGVTLGARNFQYDSQGNPMRIARHPIVEDNVTIYSNASVLGRVRIGHNSTIGGNLWITHDVPPGSRLSQKDIKKEKQ